MEKQSLKTVSLINEYPSSTDYILNPTDSGPFPLLSGTLNLKRLFLLEFLGTYIMLLFGLGSVAQIVLNNDSGGSLSIHFSWGLGVIFGIYVSDGGHLNCAITIANVIFYGFPLKKALIYILAQFFGSFLAAASVFIIYLDSFRGYGMKEGNNGFYMKVPETAVIFCTFPFSFLDFTSQTNKTISLGHSCLSEFAATFILYFLCLTFGDENKKNPGSNMTGIMIGLVVIGIGCSYGQQTGYSLNPSRDFPPRLFIFCIGWGNELFTYGNYYFWVPIVMPILGAITAGGFYEKFIREGKNKMKI